MKQINIFNEIDYLDEDGNIKRCEMCGKSCKGDVCSDKCAEDWVKKYIDNGLKN